MDWLPILVITGLLAALAMMLGLWGWRRLSHIASVERGAHVSAVALRVPHPHPAADDSIADTGSLRCGTSAGNTVASSGGAPTVVPAETAPSGPEASDDTAPDEIAMPGDGSQPCEPGIAVQTPSQPAADPAASAGFAFGSGATGSAEPDLPQAGGAEQISEITDRGAVTETNGAVVLPAENAADQDPPPPLVLPDKTGTHSGATPVVADGEGDPLENHAGAASGPETGNRDGDTADPPPSAADEAPESVALAKPESSPDQVLESTPNFPAGPATRPKRAVHRDRRGKRRTIKSAVAIAEQAPTHPEPVVRPPAEAKLRLSLHPIRRTVRLSVVMTRPDGFPARVIVQAAGAHAVEAYDEQRYDDLDLTWTSDLLEDELRLASNDGFRWLRSARQVHIFAQDPNEPELISVSAVRAGIAHTLVCRSSEAETVRLAALSTGSPEMRTLKHWQGIPEGWMVLAGYTPIHAATPPLPVGLRPLDPGEGVEISFDGGLSIRARVYAAGHPPRISITPAPGTASVTISGEPATLSSDGGWIAPAWDAPGQHIVDVVPGPSASYEIAADPWTSGGWDFWDAHPERFGDNARGPWARARICGALIRGQANETVLAAQTQPTLIALGAKSGAVPLQRRDDVAVSVGLMAEPPAFLLSASGTRRTQGRVVWLGLPPAQNVSRRYDAEWVAAVRTAAARRLPLNQADALGEDAWRKARERARRLRNRRLRT
jgi:hypothetical protein